MDVTANRLSLRWLPLQLVLLVLCASIVESCKSDQTKAPAVTTAPAQSGPTNAGSASVVTQASWAPGALEELVAPIALYPDQLLAQILAASINSQEVLDGGNWLLQNQNLSGKDLIAAANKAGFGPAMQALMQFPTVVDMMCQEIDWTRQVGSAFNSDQKSVLDAVQRLRKQATDVGNLKSTPQQTVSTKTEDSEVYVEVKPADPQVVYVPQYDPQEVYTEAPAQTTTATAAPEATSNATATTTINNTTVVEAEKNDGDDSGKTLAAGLIGFGVGMIVGNSMNDDYYYPSWGGGGVYYGGRPFYPPAYAYRPVYGAGYRPAVGYASPAGYRYNYNNVRANNNLVVNNKNYYNRFDNNQNLRTGNARSPIASTRPATAKDWKGQSTYAGAKNRPGDSRVAANTRDNRSPERKDARAPDRREAKSSDRRDAQSPDRREARGPDNREARSPDKREARAPDNREARAPDKREARSPDTRQASVADRSSNRSGNDASRADRGYSKPSRSGSREADTAGLARPTPQRESAFSSGAAKNSGSFERSASARGNASAGSRQTSSRQTSSPQGSSRQGSSQGRRR